jgi:hypothetical protein
VSRRGRENENKQHTQNKQHTVVLYMNKYVFLFSFSLPLLLTKVFVTSPADKSICEQER